MARSQQSKQRQVNQNGHRVDKHIEPLGESGRRGFNPWKFVKISFRSACTASALVNVLWPVVPAAIAVRYARHDLTLAVFILNYIAMVPYANLVGFTGQEFSRKLPRVAGILIETTIGSVVKIVLFIVLLKGGQFKVIEEAILGSILATLLLYLGLCFFVGGMTQDEQKLDEAASEVGNGLLLTAALGLIVPTSFYMTLKNNEEFGLAYDDLQNKTLQISRITAIILIIAYGFYVWFNMRTHHSLYDSIFLREEHQDVDRHKDIRKEKLTMTECIIALVLSIGLVSLIAVNLVEEIPRIVEDYGVSEMFMGLILVPLVEKFAEHITAIDEVYDNTMNTTMAHVLGATIQTAMFNGPLTVIAGWGLNLKMDLNFELFTLVIVVLSIIVVGNFLRDMRSNYLEGALCVLVYVIIAVGAFYFPNHH
ncbi:putative vacuolar cation/proton exchanger 2 [Rhexocercosporidium sp. MPI-PUGE-AT-0058]|nr:putative vacuolar cation/proton exchanger 2 [Rhexocercosporidium sp. MPI-PUGE-AT-0058]